MNSPRRVRVLIEVSRWGFVKRELHEGVARVDFISPLPCPFNYGHVPDSLGEDGDPLDAVLLGPRQPVGRLVEAEIVGRVRFVDGGRRDDKLVLSTGPLRPAEARALRAFFTLYAGARRVKALGRERVTFEGLELEAGASR